METWSTLGGIWRPSQTWVGFHRKPGVCLWRESIDRSPWWLWNLIIEFLSSVAFEVPTRTRVKPATHRMNSRFPLGHSMRRKYNPATVTGCCAGPTVDLMPQGFSLLWFHRKFGVCVWVWTHRVSGEGV